MECRLDYSGTQLKSFRGKKIQYKKTTQHNTKSINITIVFTQIINILIKFALECNFEQQNQINEIFDSTKVNIYGSFPLQS